MPGEPGMPLEHQVPNIAEYFTENCGKSRTISPVDHTVVIGETQGQH